MTEWPVVDPSPETPERLPELVAEPVWLPGPVEVQVVGGSFRKDAVREAARSITESGPGVGVLVPEPSFAEYPHAVAVYAQSVHVGYISGKISPRLHKALLRFADAHGARLVSCPARVEGFGPQVVLSLDPAPLRLPAELFTSMPDMAKALAEMLHRLDEPAPRTDPWAARGWLTLARTTRYEQGHRDETLHAYVEALYHDRDNVEAAEELFAYLALAPHGPTLADLFDRIPPASRARVLPGLLAVSYGGGRHRGLSPYEGRKLRSSLLDRAIRRHDDATVAALAADTGLHAERDGDLDTAVASWRQAVAAGCTDAKVADRFSLWLTRHGDVDEAAAVLRQALGSSPGSGTIRERLRKRLDRCQSVH